MGFQWKDTSWNIGVLSSSLLHSSSLLCTSTLPFPCASLSCKVLASIQQTLRWSFHLLHISSFPPLSYCSSLKCQNSELSGSYLWQTYLQHHHLYPWSSLQFQYHHRDCQRLWGEALLFQYLHILVWCYCNGNHTSDSCRYHDTHSAIYQLIKHEFCLLCVDCEEVYMKHCVMLNPLTPMSDQGRISPNNINTISIR